VDDIFLDRRGVVAPDRALGSLLRISGTDQVAKVLDGIFLFKNEGHGGPARHEVCQFIKEGLVPVNGVEAFRLGLRHREHLHRPYLKAGVLDAPKDLANPFLADTVGLQDGESSFGSHKRQSRVREKGHETSWPNTTDKTYGPSPSVLDILLLGICESCIGGARRECRRRGPSKRTATGRFAVRFHVDIRWILHNPRVHVVPEMKTATLGGGCFWCLEAVYQEVDGVDSVVSGYAGGDVPDPSYRQVCTGTTGHAEVTQMTYDPAVVSYRDLLEIFFTIHNPTTKDREGNDVGSQYRSIVLYHDEVQKATAESVIGDLEANGVFEDSIVTEVEPLGTFYPAEEEHQDYYRSNQSLPYCQSVISPKVSKLRRKHADKLP